MLNSLLQMIRELVADGARRGARQLRARKRKGKPGFSLVPLADETPVQITGGVNSRLSFWFMTPSRLSLYWGLRGRGSSDILIGTSGKCLTLEK